MAPEQVKGETVTPRADVYAGAIILWELLTKRRAFIRGALPEMEVLRELAEPRIVSIDIIRPDLDKSVRDAIKRALEPRGDKRTITAEEMVSVLRAVVPESEGRETLAKALALVRHEPRPSATSIPPPVTMTFGDPDPARYEPLAPMMTKPGIAPRLTPTPRRRRPGVSRQTAAYGARHRRPAPAPCRRVPWSRRRAGRRSAEPPAVDNSVVGAGSRRCSSQPRATRADPRRARSAHSRAGPRTRSTKSSATCRATCRPTSFRRRTRRAAFRRSHPTQKERADARGSVVRETRAAPGGPPPLDPSVPSPRATVVDASARPRGAVVVPRAEPDARDEVPRARRRTSPRRRPRRCLSVAAPPAPDGADGEPRQPPAPRARCRRRRRGPRRPSALER